MSIELALAIRDMMDKLDDIEEKVNLLIETLTEEVEE